MREILHAPRIVFPEAVWKRLMAYIQACPLEVGGLGTVEIRGDKLVIGEVFLLEQEVTPAETKLDPAAVARFVARFSQAGRDPSRLKFWWHSHAAMGVFWSATDLETIRELSEGGYLVSLVGNHRGETKTRLTLRAPLEISVDDLAFQIEPALDPALVAGVRDEVRSKVRQAKVGFFGRKRLHPVEIDDPMEEPATPEGRYRSPQSGRDVMPVELTAGPEKVR